MYFVVCGEDPRSNKWECFLKGTTATTKTENKVATAAVIGSKGVSTTDSKVKQSTSSMKKSRRSLDDDGSQSDDDDQFDSRGRPGISKPKHSQDSVTILETWLNSNLHKPYPTKDEKEYLMTQTGLRIKQIESWMEKQRRKRGVQKICHYTPEAKSILQNWFNANEANPYPTSDEKNDLSVQTGLTIAQISSYMEKTRAKRGLKRKSLGKSTTAGDAAQSSASNKRQARVVVSNNGNDIDGLMAQQPAMSGGMVGDDEVYAQYQHQQQPSYQPPPPLPNVLPSIPGEVKQTAEI